MHNINKLHVFQMARENLKAISRKIAYTRNFGDIRNQIQRAAISVVSNIAEGAASGTDKQFARFLSIARGSNNECYAQILILNDLGEIKGRDELVVQIEIVGKMLTKLIQKLHRT